MKTVGAYKAKSHFSELLNEVADGEMVVITKHGVPVARLAPMERTADGAAAAMQEIHRLRRELRPTLGGLTIRELIEEGRM